MVAGHLVPLLQFGFPFFNQCISPHTKMFIEDWDENIVFWNELGMGQWLFGNPLSVEERLRRELELCLEDLDSYLDNEVYGMDMEQKLLDAEFDDDDDDSDDEDESDDDGYVTGD